MYDSTVLFNQFGGRNLSVTGQRLIDDDRINLVTLNGSLSVARSGATSVDLQAVSSSSRTVAVENASAGENVTISVATRLNESVWRDLLAPELIENGGHIYDITSEPIDGSQFRELSVRLEADVEYTLRVTRVGVGTGIQDTEEAYLTTVSGNASAVPEGSTQKLVVEVRDGLNNPVSGVEVNGSANRSSVLPSTDTTDADGRITFTYEAPSDIDGGPKSVAVNLSTVVDPATRSPFDPETVDNASFSLTVRNTDGSGTGGGGSGAYSVSWLDPTSDNPNAALTNCDADSCDWDVGNSGDSTLTLRGSTNPTVDGVALDFGVDDSSVGSLSPGENTTAFTGDATTELLAKSEGTVRAFVSSGGSSDDIVIEVNNVVGGFVYNGDATAEDPDGDGTAAAVRFTMDNKFSQDLTINEVEIDPQGADVEAISDGLGGSGPYRNELFVASSPTDGIRDFGGGTSIPSSGLTMDLSVDQEAVVGGGQSATFYFSRFLDENGNSGNFQQEGMGDETVDVTIRYTLADGTTGSSTFTIQPA